jgi:hypothetical protein
VGRSPWGVRGEVFAELIGDILKNVEERDG